MTLEELRTLNLFKSLESKPEINQRQLARELDVSLGLANTYFQRVLKKGWIRAKQVKPRRWLYILTPKGVVEKSRLSISYLNRTLDSFRELKNKGDSYIKLLSEKGVTGIHLCGDNDLTEIISFSFSGFETELLSIIPENSLVEIIKKRETYKLPKLKSNELILIASLDHRAAISQFLIKNGYKENLHWIFFT